MYSSLKRLSSLIFLCCFILSLSFTALAEDDGYVNSGPGAVDQETEAEETEEVSAGIFKVTGYCGCNKCSGGYGLTYSGTVPTANHTISADLNLFPLGTKLRIGDIIYTVEDKGSSVNGNILDIYYDTHQDALDRGTYSAEVFVVERPEETSSENN